MDQMKEILENFHFVNEVWAVMLPIALMGLDIITGLVNAWIKQEVLSSKLRKGLGKKLGEIAAIIIGEMFIVAFGMSTMVADGISLYIIIMELISICENLEKLGVPIPKFIRRALAVTNENIQEDKKDEDNKEE